LPRRLWWWLAAVAFSVVGLLVLARFPDLGQSLDRPARRLLTGAADGPAPELAGDLADVAGRLGYRALWVPTALVLVATMRWRHLLVYVGSVSVVAAVAQLALGDAALARVLREGVTGSAEEVSLPAWPVLVLSTVVTASLYVIAPSGRPRRWGSVLAVAVVLAMVAARVALGLDGASTSLFSAGLGAGVAAITFLVLAPESSFPVTYRREVHAHLRLDEERTRRVVEAVDQQLGLRLLALEPYRLDGSAGSTPCRLVLEDPPGELFGKLYAVTHLRSDRWYKIVRVLRYGRLEDEAPFSSVRRLVEH
jgi:hypothetical protein